MMPVADECRPRIALRCRLGWHDWLVIEDESIDHIEQRVRDHVNGFRGPMTTALYARRLQRRVCRRCDARQDQITPAAEAIEQAMIADKLTAGRAIKANAAEGIPPPPPPFDPSAPDRNRPERCFDPWPPPSPPLES